MWHILEKVLVILCAWFLKWRCLLKWFINPFKPRVSFYTLWKYQETYTFEMFSLGIERNQWREIG